MDEDEFDRGADILPDEVLDKHLGGGPATAVSDPDDPDADPISPDDLPEDTSDEDPEEEFEDTDFGEEGEEDLDDELEDDEDDDDLDDEEEDDLEDEDEEEEDEEDVLHGRVTKEDHERIKSDPSLSRVHKEMQRAWTKKNQELATRKERIDQFEATLRNPQGLADYLGNLLTQRPDVVGAAFEAAATGEAGFDFLVEVGNHDPELFERAYDRVHELQTDEEERERHNRDRDQRSREAEVARREQRLRRQAFETDLARVQRDLEHAAERLGIDDDDMETVTARLKEQIRARVADDGSISLTKAEVRAIAKEAKDEIDKVYERAQRKLNRKQTAESQKRTKQKAAMSRGRKRIPPGSKAQRTPSQHRRAKVPAGVDPMDHFVDQSLKAM